MYIWFQASSQKVIFYKHRSDQETQLLSLLFIGCLENAVYMSLC